MLASTIFHDRFDTAQQGTCIRNTDEWDNEAIAGRVSLEKKKSVQFARRIFPLPSCPPPLQATSLPVMHSFTAGFDPTSRGPVPSLL